MKDNNIKWVKMTELNEKKVQNYELWSDKDFESLIKEIHRVNQGWHCFEIANRFLNNDNKYFQLYYLKKKNALQEELLNQYSEKVEVITLENEEYPSILIKEEYQFDGYTDACHTKKGNIK